MTRTFKVLSALLSYPTEEIKEAAPAFRAVLVEEDMLPAKVRGALLDLIGQLQDRDLYDLQERYIMLFDRTRSLSLHLFEHIHGEGRDRGQAMVDLMAHYQLHGLEISARELPDFLPLFLEFLSILPLDEAREMLSQPCDVISALGQRLAKRESPYACVFSALEDLAKEKPDDAGLQALLDEPDDDPNDLVALDQAWEAAAVTFGPDPQPTGGCPKVSDMLKSMRAAPDVNASGDTAPDAN
jgi:nitrate reductase delta subunit